LAILAGDSQNSQPIDAVHGGHLSRDPDIVPVSEAGHSSDVNYRVDPYGNDKRPYGYAEETIARRYYTSQIQDRQDEDRQCSEWHKATDQQETKEKDDQENDVHGRYSVVTLGRFRSLQPIKAVYFGNYQSGRPHKIAASIFRLPPFTIPRPQKADHHLKIGRRSWNCVASGGAGHLS
jgi:hypothetical protein